MIYGYSKSWAEALDTINFKPGEALGGSISDLQPILDNNAIYRDVLASKNSGRPGFYYGRDVVIEGSLPTSLFILAAEEFGGDDEWYRDDKKFDSFMKRHPEWDWRTG